MVKVAFYKVSKLIYLSPRKQLMTQPYHISYTVSKNRGQSVKLLPCIVHKLFCPQCDTQTDRRHCCDIMLSIPCTIMNPPCVCVCVLCLSMSVTLLIQDLRLHMAFLLFTASHSRRCPLSKEYKKKEKLIRTAAASFALCCRIVTDDMLNVDFQVVSHN